MSTLISKKIKLHVAEQLVESITEPANNVYYLVASKHTPYSSTTGDVTVPAPLDSYQETSLLFYEEAIFGKKVNSSDVSLGVPKKMWTSGTRYAMYDDQDGELFNKDFYAAVDAGSTYYVYKVLDNNDGAISNVSPYTVSSSESACNFITTGDGYTWKLLYKMGEAEFEKFSTNSLMPVATSANVSGNTISGSIDVIKVVSRGSNYIATLSGTFQADDLRESIPTIAGTATTYRLNTAASSLNDYYKDSVIYINSGPGAGEQRTITDYNGSTRVATVNSSFTTPPSSLSTYSVLPNVIVTGDGTGAVAHAIVSSNTSVNNFISKVRVVSRGSEYTYATASVKGYTGGVSNNAVVRVILPPPGGHGNNSPEELGSDSIIFSAKFNQSESTYITTENDYRKVALIKDPLFSSVTLEMTSVQGEYSGTENIFQVNQKTLTGTVTGNTTSTTLSGTATQFDKALKVNDYILIADNATNVRNVRKVTGITNSTSLSLNANLSTSFTLVNISQLEITSTAKRTGGSLPTLEITNVEPKFLSGKLVVGESSGALGTISTILINEKSYNNWNFFDNRTRITMTASSGTIPEDAVVYQEALSLSNAYYHSSNGTYVYLTSEKGPINPDPTQQLIYGSNTITLGSTKYSPDIIKRSGKVLYIENNEPISRSNSQSETIKLTIKF